MRPKEIVAKIKEENIRMIDIRYMDFPGTWQHFSVPACEVTESSFEDGFGFDGSSMRAWQNIDNSDMIVIPDSTTAKMDPFFAQPTLVLIGDVKDPITGESYSRDPRYIARKVEQYVKSTGLGDTIFVGPEPEFFIFNNVRYGCESNSAFYELDSDEAIWNSGRDEMPNTGYKIRHKHGYYPLPPSDKY
ncbi:MAG: glutamine synthetase beta-grasp domain-containing protein, partial [Desulfamplus sp.]|nr:glutamine synthetase beta-grasp domain-containing protein [Desulfamplus sp.]